MGTLICLEFPSNKKDIILKVSDVILLINLTKIQENGGGTNKFTFDKVFDTNSNQKEVYELAAKPIIESKHKEGINLIGVLDGFNGTIFAYG